MKAYNEWLSIAKRYDKSVDYSSPMTAWSIDMLKAHRLANGSITEALEILKRLNNANK